MPNVTREESIKLSFPVNAAYVSSARLTASSIANRMGFDIDEIEDIKAAVSEACTYIIKTMTVTPKSSFEISFDLNPGEMAITIITLGETNHQPQSDEMSMMMIQALVDELKITGAETGNITIRMTKKHKASIFG
jgi:serine/threonine-protein kinase RsbW